MHNDRFRHHRNTLRLRGYDYRRAAAYFVTVRTAARGDILGAIVEGKMTLNDRGRIVDSCWRAIPAHHPGVRLDLHIAMPDHIHGIIVLPQGVPASACHGKHAPPERGAQCIAPLQEKRQTSAVSNHDANTALVAPGSLGCVIRTFKAAVTRELNRRVDPPGGSFWQRNYYERIIRDGAELMAIRRYIRDNPAHLEMDSAAEPL